MDTEKALLFLTARAVNSVALKPFHVRIENNTRYVEATIYDRSKMDVLARVSISESVPALQLTGFDHQVNVSYPAQNGRAPGLLHTSLAAAIAACDLAELLDAHMRTG